MPDKQWIEDFIKGVDRGLWIIEDNLGFQRGDFEYIEREIVNNWMRKKRIDDIICSNEIEEIDTGRDYWEEARQSIITLKNEINNLLEITGMRKPDEI